MRSTRRLVPGSESHCSNSFSTKSGLDLRARGETSASCNNSASNDATSQEISMFIETRPWLSHELHRYQHHHQSLNPRCQFRRSKGYAFKPSWIRTNQDCMCDNLFSDSELQGTEESPRSLGTETWYRAKRLKGEKNQERKFERDRWDFRELQGGWKMEERGMGFSRENEKLEAIWRKKINTSEK